MAEQTLTKTNLPFQLKGSLFTLTLFQLRYFNLEDIEAHLLKLIHKTPNFFKDIPVVIDCHKLIEKNTSFDFSELLTLLRKHGLIPVGLRAGDEVLEMKARAAGLAIFPLSRHEQIKEQQKSDSSQQSSSTKVEKILEPPPSDTKSKLITQPIRSGQQVYARGGDLIVMAAVSHGAELLADGHIHVYGPLRGRALAGVQGNKEARIFCHQLEPELIAIAGHYEVNENIHMKEKNGPVQIFLRDDHLHIELL